MFKLSGKRTVAGPNSGEHTYILSVTDGESFGDESLRYKDREQEYKFLFVCLLLFLKKKEGVDFRDSKTDASL